MPKILTMCTERQKYEPVKAGHSVDTQPKSLTDSTLLAVDRIPTGTEA